MRKKLHPLVLTIAICQVVLGVLALGCDGFGLLNAAGLLMMSNGSAPTPQPAKVGPGRPTNPNDSFQRGLEAGTEAEVTVLQQAPLYAPVQMAQALVGLFLVLLMVVSGSGLFFMQSWARWTAVVYGVLSILTRCVCLGYHAAVVLPIYNRVGEAFVQSGAPDMNSNLWLVKYGAFMRLLVGLYPLLVIVVMLLPNVARAFRGEPVKESFQDDYRNDYRDHPRDDDRGGYRRGDSY